MLTAEQKVLFKLWSAEKRLISIIVRSKMSFFLELEDLKRPDDVALIAFVPETSKNSISERAYYSFDLIIYYDASKNTQRNVQHFDEVRIPDLEALGDELKPLIDLSKLQLVYSNESAPAPVCQLRQRVGLKGPFLPDLAHIRNKDLVKAVARENGIPTAKSTTVNFAQLDCEIPIIISKIENVVGGYPMFKRPISLGGCRGVEKIPSRRALLEWVKEGVKLNVDLTYLIEEFLKGREFLAIICLLQDGSFEPLVVKYLEHGWSNVMHIDTGRPVPVFVDSFYNAETEFPNLLNFASRVVDAFKPPCPQIFCIQGFQRSPQSDDYWLVELAHRPAGSRTNSVCYKSCGISQETALIMSHIDPRYRPKVDPSWKRPTELALWFPQRKGVLKSHTPLPGKENVKSEIRVKWMLPLGTVMEQPKDINKHVLILTLFCEDRNQLLKDAKWIADNWRPVIV